MSEGMPQKMLGIMIAHVIVARAIALIGTTTPQTSDTIENGKISERNEKRLSNDASVTQQPRGPYSSVDISEGSHSREFREFTIDAFGSTTESNTREGQVDDFQPNSKNYECCFDSECNSILGSKSHCNWNEYGTERMCIDSRPQMPRKKRELDDTEETTTVETEPTSMRDDYIPAGICVCDYGFVNINSSCKFDSDGAECCYEMQCYGSLGTYSTCDHTSGAEDEICFTFRPKRDLGFVGGPNNDYESTDSGVFKGKCTCKPGFEQVNGECVYSVAPSITPDEMFDVLDITEAPSRTPKVAVTFHSGINSTVESMTGLCMERVCSRGECRQYNRPDEFICGSSIDDLKCYVAKQCVADDFIYIFSCEDPCLNMTTSSPYSCYSEFCTTPLCNSNSTLVDDFQCSTAGVIYVSTYLWVLMLLCYVNN